MKAKWKIALIATLTAATAIASASAAIAWFDNKVSVGINDNITGRTNGAYFAYGNGSAEEPFGINAARHIYNLAWLQYLGYFNNNIIGPDSGPVYFEIDPSLEGELDMSSIVIPPIGTSEFPFKGYFDGNNKEIVNLKVDNVVASGHIEKKPSVIKSFAVTGNNILKESIGGATYHDSKTVNIMGMFGKTQALNENDQTSHIFDFKLENATISSSSSQLLVGVAVGYLDSKMTNVAVSSPSINIENSPALYTDMESLSEYTLVGHAEEQYVAHANKKTVTAEKPLVDHTSTSGVGTEFGASIPMKDIYNRLLTKHNESEPFKYNEIWDGEVDSDPSKLTKEPIYSYLGTGTNNPYAYYGTKEKDSGNNEIASYSFVKRPGTDAFMYLYGEDSGAYNQTIDGNVSIEGLNAGNEFCIGDGKGNWIGCTSLEPLNSPNYQNTIQDNSDGFAIKTTTSLDEAIKWVYDNGRIRTSKVTRTSRELTSVISHYGFLALNNSNLLIARTGRPNNVGFSWTKQEYYETEIVSVDVGDGTQQEVEKIHTYRVFMTTSQNGQLMPNGLPYTAYLVCDNGSWTVNLQDSAAHYFMQGNKYLKANPSSNSISLVDSIDNASKWYTGSSGGWMVEYNNTFYTLGVTTRVAGRHWISQREYYAVDSNLKFSSNPAEELAATYNKADTSDGRFRMRANITDLLTNISLFGNTETDYYFYLRLSNNSIIAVTQANNEDASVGAEFIDTSNVDEKAFALEFKTTSQTISTNWHSNPTYFPLSYATPEQIAQNPSLAQGDVSPKNTGYIVSGSNYAPDNGNFPGDIRVSDYVNNNNNNGNNNRLRASLGGGSTYNNLAIVTHEKSATGRYVAIKDDYNTGLNAVPNTLSGVATTFKTPEEMGLIRYEDSRLDMHTQFTNDFSHIHGLHFMNSEISTSRITTVPNAHILGQTYTNYPMPEDCIDFNLNKHGFITFYAGTYFSGNNTFFSLHEIIRNADKSIPQDGIKQITKVYDNVGTNRARKRYIYDYSSGNNMGEGDTKGDMIFDMTWVTNPTIVNNAVYYFEIPVNSGEYALGSVSGREGAYLMYLDIGSARKNEDITTIQETIVTENTLSEYVSGVDFASSSSTSSVTGGDVGNVIIPAGSSGLYSFSYENGTLSCSSGSDAVATHIGEGVTLSNIEDGTTEGDTVQVDRTTTINYNDFDETTTTTVRDVTTTNNGTPVAGDPVTTIQYNVLTYDSTIEVIDATGTIIRFRYWGNVSFTTNVDFRNKVYTFIFDTNQPLEIFAELLTPGENGFTVQFKGNGEGAIAVPAVQGEYATINNSSPSPGS